MTDRNHPASSVEFLSRLHDGEVLAPERRAFDEHRAACADCRSAADAFEASIAAFRASDVAPTPADLSARILRKIRSQSPSRRPFGVMFGIDVRWAGLLVAGLLAVLLSAPLVLRKPTPTLTPRPPISAYLVDTPAESKAPEPPPPAPAASVGHSASAPAAPPPSARLESAQKQAVEAPAEDEKRRFAPVPPAASKSTVARRSQSAPEPQGGESASAAEDAVAGAAALRLIVSSLDGEGEPPGIVSAPDEARLAELRGREYLVTVEASGRVRSVERSIANGFVAPPSAKTRSPAAMADVAIPAGPLDGLRFAPGDRPRRLTVRIE